MGVKDLIIIEETGHLISCAFDGKIHIWDYKEKKREKVLKNHFFFYKKKINYFIHFS